MTDAVTLAAALLHDTIEDTDTTLEELAAVFGKRIAAVVLEVTDDKVGKTGTLQSWSITVEVN